MPNVVAVALEQHRYRAVMDQFHLQVIEPSLHQRRGLVRRFGLVVGRDQGIGGEAAYRTGIMDR